VKTRGRAVVYARVSTEEQVSHGVSLDLQEERLVAYCKAHGLEVAAIIREEGVSASKPLASRPGGQKLTRLFDRREANHVVALKLDRLFRDAADALTQSRAWDRAGVALHLVDMGGSSLNTASAVGRLFLTMTAAFAELERNLISERTSAALQFKKRSRQVYTLVPYGFHLDGRNLVDAPAELAVVRRMRKWRAGGWSYWRIAAELNRRGTPTKLGARWHPSTVRYMLVKTHAS
jgi:DNA invertase Pin-like site-specific DNA recombinase